MFKFSKKQLVQALERIHDDVKPGTKGVVKTHRNLGEGAGNEYLVKFKGHENWYACFEHQLSKV